MPININDPLSKLARGIWCEHDITPLILIINYVAEACQGLDNKLLNRIRCVGVGRYLKQCFPQVENLLVVVGDMACDGTWRREEHMKNGKTNSTVYLFILLTNKLNTALDGGMVHVLHSCPWPAGLLSRQPWCPHWSRGSVSFRTWRARFRVTSLWPGSLIQIIFCCQLDLFLWFVLVSMYMTRSSSVTEDLSVILCWWWMVLRQHHISVLVWRPYPPHPQFPWWQSSDLLPYQPLHPIKSIK